MSGVLQAGLIHLEASGTGVVGGEITGCTLRAQGSATVDRRTRAGVIYAFPDGNGVITTDVGQSLFEGSDQNGLVIGIDLSLTYLSAGTYTGRFDFGVSGSTFTRCSSDAISILTVPSPGAVASPATSSFLAITDSRFSLTGPMAPANVGGQIVIDFGWGHKAAIQITGNTIKDRGYSKITFTFSAHRYAGRGCSSRLGAHREAVD